MIRDRLIVILILIPTGVAVLVAGGAVFTVLIALLLGMASWEYARLFSAPEKNIPPAILAAGCAGLVILRGLSGFDHTGVALSGIILFSVVWFLLRFEFAGEKKAATAMGITLGGTLYLGWLGGYFVSVRLMPYGYWWLMICLAAVGAADSTAYLVGRKWGRHPLARLISPKKTWEGYFGGVAGATLVGLAIAWLFQWPAGAESGIHPTGGLLIGLLIGLISPLGDLAISMIKREVAQKDSGDFFPGHGGVLDRIDSWLITAVIGYYVIIGLVPLLPF
ncbi:MAG: phosphatidate cytidylyltransferase [Anaerolineales bacterium]